MVTNCHQNTACQRYARGTDAQLSGMTLSTAIVPANSFAVIPISVVGWLELFEIQIYRQASLPLVYTLLRSMDCLMRCRSSTHLRNCTLSVVDHPAVLAAAMHRKQLCARGCGYLCCLGTHAKSAPWHGLAEGSCGLYFLHMHLDNLHILCPAFLPCRTVPSVPLSC